MSGILGGFIRRMKHKCMWSKRQDVDERGKVTYGVAIEIPCIFLPTRQLANARFGGVVELDAKFFVKAEHIVSIGDKLEHRGRTYIIEYIKDIEWFGGVHDGYKCLCRQEGGVAV